MTTESNFKVLSVAVVLYLSTIQETTAACSSDALNSALKRFRACPKLNPLNPEHLGELTDARSFCESLECTLKCLNDAIGNCTDTGYFRIADMGVYKTYFRYACSDLTGLHQALRDCTGPLLDNICVMNKNAAMRHALLEFSLKPFDTDTDGFVDEFCRALNKSRMCALQEPIQPTLTCSAEEADVLNNLMDINSSISGCGQSHTNSLFSVYGGPLQCDEISSSCSLHVQLLALLICLALLILVR